MSHHGRSENNEAINWHEIFSQIDSDQDGYILKTELKQYLLNTPINNVPISDDLVNSMISRIDLNDDGYINLEEFCRILNICPYMKK